MLERTQLRRHSGNTGRADMVWRLRTDTPLRDWVNTLDDRTWAAVTAGRDLCSAGAARGHLQHNLIAADLAIRSHEVVPTIVGAAGEPLSDPWMLLPPCRDDDMKRTRWRADMTWLRVDGLRIVVEVVVGTGVQTIAPKVARWARYLARHDWNDLGVCVLFVNASDRHKSTAEAFRQAVAQETTAKALGRNGIPASPSEVRRARSALLLASWREWFPGPFLIGESFQRLSVAYTPDGSRWEYADLADTERVPFRPADPMVFIDAVVNFGLLAHTPAWRGRPPVEAAEVG